MWQHNLVARPIHFFRSIAALFLTQSLFCPWLSPQSQARAPRRATSHAEAQTFADLSLLISAQQKAVQAGDATTIAETSRVLIAKLLDQMATLQLAEGDPTSAVQVYRRVLEVEPSAEIRLKLASTQLRSGKAADAATTATEVTVADPRNGDAWAVLGSALRSSGRDKDAVHAFQQALGLHPDNASIAYALASSLLAIHDKSGADHILQEIIRGSGNDAVWRVAVGDAYREAGYLNDAVSAFRAAIARDPKAPHAEFFLGLTYLQMNEWGPNSQSFEHLRAATRISPNDYVSNFYLGALESTDGSDLVASNRHLRAAAKADPSEPEVWLYLGLNANREKDVTAARENLQKAIDLTGSDEARNNYQVRRAYFALGRLLIAQGERAAGEALLAKYKRAEQGAVAESAAMIVRTENPDGVSHAAAALSSSASVESVKPSPVPSALRGTTLTKVQREQIHTSELQLRELLAKSYNDLGTAEARQQQYAVALTSFQQAEQWETPSPTLLHNLGVAAFRTEDYAEATRALAQYVDHEGAQTDHRSVLMLAYAEFSMGKFDGAAKHFAQAQDVALQDARTAYAWAFSLTRTSQQMQANKIADQLTGRDLPSDALALVCHLYVDTEDYEQSTSCYRKLSTQDPNAKLAHYQVGEALIRLDRPAEAVPELRKELELSPKDANVASALAFALIQTSQKAEAETLLRQVTTNSPAQAEAQYQYGKLLLDSERATEAIPHLEAAEQLDPDKDYIHYQLQSAYRHVGRTADATREASVYKEIKDRHRDAAVLTAPHSP